jgi:ergothioneine biosynthesis protein EgtB
MPVTPGLLAGRLSDAFERARMRTRAIFSLAEPEAFYLRPIPLRHPLAFYLGHLDAFAINTLLAEPLGLPRFAPELDALFARGIDPSGPEAEAGPAAWPPREAIEAYAARAEERMREALAGADAWPDPEGTAALFYLVLEHELMHQETLMYLIHQLPEPLKSPPAYQPPAELGPAPAPYQVAIPPGPARLGARAGEFPHAWDNEFPAHEEWVPGFAIDAYNVTNGEFLVFVESGGYREPAWWRPEAWAWREAERIAHPRFWRRQEGGWLLRDLFGWRPLPLSWPAIVTQAEADAFARWRGMRLPSEAEWQRAAYGDDPDRPYPWGDAPPGPRHGNFDFRSFGPVPVGACPDGASAYGVFDLVGNGWEWTRTPFAPFAGFRPDPRYAGYSRDFFDGAHYVLKGGSWATDARLLRRSFRNWFYWHYPYAYASFRCVAH